MLLIFVDDLHFEPEYSPNVRKLYSTLVDTLVHDGDLAAVVLERPVVDRNPADLRPQTGRRRGVARFAARR